MTYSAVSVMSSLAQQKENLVKLENLHVVSREMIEDVRLNETNPIFVREIGIVGQTDEVHILYNCSAGGLKVGLIEQSKWQQIKNLSPDIIREDLPNLCNDLKEIPTKPTTVGTMTLPGITLLPNITIPAPTSGETVLTSKGRLQAEVLFALKGVSDTRCTFHWQVWAFPNKDKYSVQIADAETKITEANNESIVGGLAIALALFVLGGFLTIYLTDSKKKT
jgi:hypothetical protein